MWAWIEDPISSLSYNRQAYSFDLSEIAAHLGVISKEMLGPNTFLDQREWMQGNVEKFPNFSDFTKKIHFSLKVCSANHLFAVLEGSIVC